MNSNPRERISWWQVALVLGVAPAVVVPFVPFVADVVPWEEIESGFSNLSDAGGTLWLALPLLLGLVLVVVIVRALILVAPLRFEYGLAWIASALAVACVAIWYGQFWTEFATDSSLRDDPLDVKLATAALIAVPPVCLAVGVIWFRRGRRRPAFAPKRAVIFASLVYLADVGSAVLGFANFPKNLGWYCGVIACVGVIGELIRVASRPSRGAAAMPS